MALHSSFSQKVCSFCGSVVFGFGQGYDADAARGRAFFVGLRPVVTENLLGCEGRSVRVKIVFVLAATIATGLAGCLQNDPLARATSETIDGVRIEWVRAPAVVSREYGEPAWSFRAVNGGNRTWTYVGFCGPKEPWSFALEGSSGRYDYDSPNTVVDCIQLDRLALRPGDRVSGNLSWKKTWWSDALGYSDVPPGNYDLIVRFWMQDGQNKQTTVEARAPFVWRPA